MNRYIIYFIGLTLWISTMAAAQADLERYLIIAAENNPGLKAKFNSYMAALEVGPQVKALPDPQVAFAYFVSPVQTRVGPQQFRISASQMFPWMGTLKAKENVAIQSAKASYEEFLEAKSKLFDEVRSTYFNIYVNRRAIEITGENLAILASFQKLAEIKAETGKVPAVDGYRIAMETGDLENQLALLRDEQNVLEVSFKNLLNTDETGEILTPVTLWTDDLPFSKEAVMDSIRARNHQLLALSMQQEALHYREALAEKLGKPGFSVGLDYTVIGNEGGQMAGTDAFVFPMVGITIPLYRNKYRAMVNEIAFLQEARGQERDDHENFLETVLEKGWKDYLDSGRRIGLYATQLELAGKTLELLETEYSTGSMDFEEVLRMERKMLAYGFELEKARGDKQAAISFINYLMGI
jgi:cobalt-zinc-cadmium efflux system outer membrane protein